jgi:hypothetical protein
LTSRHQGILKWLLRLLGNKGTKINPVSIQLHLQNLDYESPKPDNDNVLVQKWLICKGAFEIVILLSMHIGWRLALIAVIGAPLDRSSAHTS